MIAIEAAYVKGTGFPYQGGATISITTDQIKSFGKLDAYCDFVTRYIAVLHDGRLVFPRTATANPDELRWIRKQAKLVKTSGYPTRDNPVRIFFNEVQR